ncbi:MAG: hypothetical protein IKZ58_05435 [Selenomonadaceae bacterium]|nr:hypothetical protein [Selenomonadaceae bacterium]
MKIFLTVIFFLTMIFNSTTALANKTPVIIVQKFDQEVGADIPVRDVGELVSDLLIEQFMDTGKFQIVDRKCLEDNRQKAELQGSEVKFPKIDYEIYGKIKLDRVAGNIHVTCEMNILDKKKNNVIWSGKAVATENELEKIYSKLESRKRGKEIRCHDLMHIVTHKIVLDELCQDPNLKKMFEGD